MNTRPDSNSVERGAEVSNTLVAIFSKTDDAREAIKELHKANLKKTWLGITKPADDGSGEPLVEEKGGALGFLNADRTTLSRALLQRGISDRQAQEIEGQIAPGAAVVTVYGEDDPGRAAQILGEKGRVVEGDWEPPASTAVPAAASTARPASDLTNGDTSPIRGQWDDHAEDEFVYGRTSEASTTTPAI